MTLLLKGSLSDTRLAALLQAAYNARLTGFVWLCDQRKEGLVHLRQGRIAHAVMGDHKGAEGLYGLSLWLRGTFRLYRQSADFPLPATPLLDYPQDHSALTTRSQAAINRFLSLPITALNQAEEEADQMWEAELISWLSKLENQKTALIYWGKRQRPQGVLQQLDGMVNLTAELGEHAFDSHATFLHKAWQMAQDLYPVAVAVRLKENRLERSLATFYVKGNGTGEQFGRTALDILESYVYRFLPLFHTSAMVEQWRDTCQTYLAEVGTALTEIAF